MATADRMILLEFNELTPTLLDRFMARGLLPNFKRFHDESHVFITDAEESGDRLNPWVQWVTVHSGLSLDDHGVLRLNEGHKLSKQRVWDVVSSRGRRVLVCGSMNVGYDDPLNGFVVPDPWSTTVAPYPPDAGLDAFYRFVQTQVQEHTNDKVPLKTGDYVRFVRFMVGHGLTAHTALSILKQLVQERLGAGKWKRAVLLDKLQFDVFRALYRRNRPHFSTFFLNSTAHMQHAYWRHMDPEPFAVKPSDEDRAEYGEAVLFGYQEMDGILGRFLDMAGRDTTLVFSTALGQQPYLDQEETGGKRFYRPRDFEKVLAFAGIPAGHKVAPVMSEEFHVYFSSETDAVEGERLLAGLQVDGRALMKVDRREQTGVFAGVGIFEAIPREAVLANVAGDTTSFYDLFYQPDTLKSGKHHPHGAFWIRSTARRHQRHDDPVSLRAVAPTLLSLMGIDPPEYMQVEPLQMEPQPATV